ncbi:Sensor protein ZraS [Maioricimonas rarisocia]|uniref:histidine kinase n=1 Tax=Maioricimonas rarisocia TaxID=2528026 RepID=A0A517Z5U6_9PLAN|nr:ATP-binding protein [Maioricimonas rarisocia]QDU37847.1 Sensor protein ZraS [Maioricimonas rarisocia]
MNWSAGVAGSAFSSTWLRLSAPVILLSLLLFVVAAGAGWWIWQEEQQSTRLLEDSLESARVAHELEDLLNGLHRRLSQYVVSGEEKHLDSALGMNDDADRCLIRAERLELTTDGRNLVSRVRRQYTVVYQQVADLSEQTATQSNRQEVKELLDEVLTPELLDRVSRYRSDYENRLASARNESRHADDRMAFLLIALGLCGAIAGLMTGWSMARNVHRSLVELSVPIHDAAGTLNEVVGPIRVHSAGNLEEMRSSLDDMSARVGTVVERLQQAQQDALRAEQLAALGQLAAGLAHELRNPLTAMKTLIQSAQQDPEQSSLTQEDLDVLGEEIDRLNRTIQTFLDYARPPRLHRQSVDLRTVIGDLARLTAHRLQRQHVQLDQNIDAGLPSIQADPDQLRQVLLNLILNALDAQPDGGRIRVQARPVESTADEPDLVRIVVSDDGTGVPAEMRDRIFEPFVSSRDAGTGLGLSICRRIIEQHHGTIQLAEPSAERGAAFVIELPVHD